MRLRAENSIAVVAALGTAQTIAWGASYYIPAVLATPMAASLGVSAVWVFAAFSMAMIVSAFVAPWAGKRIDERGGGGVLVLSNFIFAAGLVLLGLAQGLVTLGLAWFLIGLGMGIGLYDAAFAALARIYGSEARSPITGITLIAGFASTVAWPLSALMEAEWGWRAACFAWAAIHLVIALPLNLIVPGTRAPSLIAAEARAEAGEGGPPPSRLALWLLAFVFAVTWFSSTAMAAHLPRLLEAAGATTAMAVAAGALIGPAQVAARIAEFGLLRRFHPLVSARIACAAHPLGAAVLLALGGPAAYGFALLHGAGNGVLTIAKGTLPLALFGPVGYGLRQGLINAPARALQALAPLIFGFALEKFGANAVWITVAINLAALAALMVLKPRMAN